MIAFWIVAALLLAAALAVLLRPLLRPAEPEAEEEPVAALFRRQLAELEADMAQGRLAAEEAERARAETTRRMLAEAERRRRPAPAAGRGDRIWRFATAVGLAGLVPAAALAVYYMVGAPATIGGAAASAVGPHSLAELQAAATRLEARVKQAPGDRDSRVMLARTLAALGRFEQAEDAFHQAIALAPNAPELHAELGEVLVLAAQGRVTPAAEAEFAKAPHDPRARYYEAAAAAQRGDVAGAKRALAALLADAPADAPWRKTVEQGLRALAPAPQAAAATNSPSGRGAAAPAPPKAADPAAMVARLAARLERQPGDVAGWLMLARSYRVLGRDADALAALKRANRSVPGNLTLLQHYLDALAAGLKDGRPTPELVDVARRVHALDADAPDALWYLGLAAQQRGDRFAAAKYWTKLVSELPGGSGERAVVQQKLDSLR
ncbi:MAG TPA: c-type cytochrome biogenesis protein CcmI [Stellaceae bacterium]|nr:c-type cytochrome biogenesis protein CcmI [Stellaceae bacterium]